MLKRIKSIIYDTEKLALNYERKGKYEKAFKEYLNAGNDKKAAEMLGKMGKWHEAACLYIKNQQIDAARGAIENCFRKNLPWEKFNISADGTQVITVEDWLKRSEQTRRFVRYIQNVDKINDQGIPLIVVLAAKLRGVEEYKSAAELYRWGFFIINRDVRQKQLIKHEEWLRNACECYSKIHLYSEAAICMKDLMMTEVEIGSDMSKNVKYNPYRNYLVNLKLARDLNFLEKLLEILEDFDPFNIAYDLLKMGERTLSVEIFFKYYGRLAKKSLTEEELEVRNEKISYCLNQYVIYFREKEEYQRAAQVALLNNQKKIAADLYKMAQLKQNNSPNQVLEAELSESETEPSKPTPERKVISMEETSKCSHCGESVQPNWEVCPSCKNVLILKMCECGEKLKPHWKLCPSCGKELG
jgi:hypothetical protein